MVRTIFAQPDPDQVWAQHRRITDHLHQVGLRDAAEHLDVPQHRSWSSPGSPKPTGGRSGPTTPRRLNKEIRRRTNVVGIFPTRGSIIRLVGALLAEQHDEWAIARRYMSLDSLAQTRIRLIEPDHPRRSPQHSKQQPARNKTTRPTRYHPYTTSLDVTETGEFRRSFATPMARTLRDMEIDTSGGLRCRHCGNRTRFDVVELLRRRRFHHYDLGGALTVESEDIVDLTVERITCRWCDRSDGIEQPAGVIGEEDI